MFDNTEVAKIQSYLLHLPFAVVVNEAVIKTSTSSVESEGFPVLKGKEQRGKRENWLSCQSCLFPLFWEWHDFPGVRDSHLGAVPSVAFPFLCEELDCESLELTLALTR